MADRRGTFSREREVEAAFCKRVEHVGCWPLKLTSPGVSGVPDRLVLVPGGRVIFVELKAPGKRERARQEYIQGKMRDMGFTVFSAVDSSEKIDDVLEACERLKGGG